MSPGDSKMVRIAEAAAFGPRRHELVRTIDREGIAADLQPQVGQHLQAVDAEGRSIRAIIKDISAQSVTIDANHPFCRTGLELRNPACGNRLTGLTALMPVENS
jgi:FKBP-type peptidyl-prolyl cis-trans isomerase 2